MTDRRQTDNNLPILLPVNAIYKELILKGRQGKRKIDWVFGEA